MSAARTKVQTADLFTILERLLPAVEAEVQATATDEVRACLVTLRSQITTTLETSRRVARRGLHRVTVPPKKLDEIKKEQVSAAKEKLESDVRAAGTGGIELEPPFDATAEAAAELGISVEEAQVEEALD